MLTDDATKREKERDSKKSTKANATATKKERDLKKAAGRKRSKKNCKKNTPTTSRDL
jgi:hypothetical protein